MQVSCRSSSRRIFLCHHILTFAPFSQCLLVSVLVHIALGCYARVPTISSFSLSSFICLFTAFESSFAILSLYMKKASSFLMGVCVYLVSFEIKCAPSHSFTLQMFLTAFVYHSMIEIVYQSSLIVLQF